MTHRFFFMVIALGALACSGSDESAASGMGGQGNGGPGGGGGSGDGTGGTGGTGGTAECSTVLKGEEPQPVKIRIENKTGASIYIEEECYAGGPDGISVDDKVVLDIFYTYNCDDVLEGKCLGFDCFGEPDVEVPADMSFEDTWNGLLRDTTDTQVPSGCQVDCMPNFPTCRRQVPAAPGEHTLKVQYRTSMAGPLMEHEVKFTMPTSMVTATIGMP